MKNGRPSMKMRGKQKKPQKVNGNVLWTQRFHASHGLSLTPTSKDFHLPQLPKWLNLKGGYAEALYV